MGSLSSLESAEDQIAELEAQLIVDQGEASRYDVLEKELVALKAETTEIQARTKAEMEKAEEEKTATVAQVAESAKLRFDRCKILIAVSHPQPSPELPGF